MDAPGEKRDMTSENPDQFLCSHCNEWHPDQTDVCPTTGTQITDAQKLEIGRAHV